MAKILEFNLENEVLLTETKKILYRNFSPKKCAYNVSLLHYSQGIYILLTKEQKSRHQICVSTTYIYDLPLPLIDEFHMSWNPLKNCMIL